MGGGYVRVVLPAGHHTTTASTTTYDDVKLLRESARRRIGDVLSHDCWLEYAKLLLIYDGVGSSWSEGGGREGASGPQEGFM
jgi:hypothetical protein